MAGLSIGQALDAGLSVATKRPLTVMVWGLARLALTVGPVLLILSLAAPQLIAAFQESGAAADPRAAEKMFSGIWAFQAAQPVAYLGGIVSTALLGAAATRAVMTPRDDGRFYLRLGSRELWFGLVFVVLTVLITMVAVVTILVLALVIGLAAGATAMARGGMAWEPWMLLPIVLGCLAVGVAVLWLWLRLSMALPMTFRDDTFRLFESWRLTMGRAWSLFLLGLLLLLVFLGIEIAAFAVVGAVGVILALLGAAAMGFDTLSQRSLGDWAWLLAVLGLLALPVIAYVSGLAYALFFGGWANAFRQLTGSDETQGDPA